MMKSEKPFYENIPSRPERQRETYLEKTFLTPNRKCLLKNNSIGTNLHAGELFH